MQKLRRALRASVFLADYAAAFERLLVDERVNYARRQSAEGDDVFHIGWTLPRTGANITFAACFDKSETMVRIVCYKFLVGVPTHLRANMLSHINAANARCTCFKFFLDPSGDVQVSYFFIYDSPHSQFVPEEVLHYIGRLVHFLDHELPSFHEVAHGAQPADVREQAPAFPSPGERDAQEENA